ncbi:MAG TPA: hypothetical protein H9899_06980 [Candidatus Sphingomonas excrementigallinarum]|nr:hypothetical protein [Candidatus Sphingomonas excrementigallinarum]
MSAYHEGNTQYRLHKLLASRQYRITAVAQIKGRASQFAHKVNDVGQGDREAFLEGIDYLRPQVARAESLANGIDPALPADPVIDKAVAREAEQRRHREEAEAEALAIKEAAGAYLNEQHPLWGTF